MRPDYRRIVLTSCFIQFVVTLSLTFVNAFLTLFIYEDLGVSDLSKAAVWSGLGTFLGGTCLAMSSPIWGWLTDRFGAKRMMVRVLITHSILTGLFALAADVQTVLILRTLRGLLGGTSVVAMAAIASIAREKDLAGALGYQQSAQILGGMVGPVFGALAAPVIGFRACFAVSSISIACAIPLALSLAWPEAEGTKVPTPNFRGLASMRLEFGAMVLLRASLTFIGPVLPVYLVSAGIGSEDLTLCTGIVLAISDLAFAVAVPLTSKSIPPALMPALLTVQGGAIMAQGLFVSLPCFLALRLAQVVAHSPAPAQLFTLASAKTSEKGTTIGLISSARFLGGAISPIIASTANYWFGLAFSFGCMSSMSLGAAFLVWRLLEHNARDRPDGR